MLASPALRAAGRGPQPSGLLSAGTGVSCCYQQDLRSGEDGGPLATPRCGQRSTIAARGTRTERFLLLSAGGRARVSMIVETIR